jgi:hypothetical protein
MISSDAFNRKKNFSSQRLPPLVLYVSAAPINCMCGCIYRVRHNHPSFLCTVKRHILDLNALDVVFISATTLGWVDTNNFELVEGVLTIF